MDPVRADFDLYRLQYYNGKAYVSCWQGPTLAGTLVFLPDSTTLPANRLSETGRPILYYPMSRFADVMGILRHESPLYLWFNPDNQLGCLSTALEPIGELEGLTS